MTERDDEASTGDDRIGKLVDERYRVLEAMAAGAMGAVYRAERVPVGKIVAIKFLHKSFAKDSEFLIRFERETRAMSQLAHPNCVSVVDFGVWDEAPYLVMDYVAGTTLRKILDDEEIVPMRALAIGRQIAAGIAHAHARGIIHRDIKPANIMITDEIGAGEHVRLLDFGLARLRGGGGLRDATQSNVVVGTPNYMAPEQTVPGMTIDARADIYAVGIVLYEMLAGERPFYAADTMALLGMHRHAPVPRLADKFKDPSVLPEGIQVVIDTALAKSPDDRYQTAIELATAIEGVITGGRPEVMRAIASAPLAAAKRNQDSSDAVAATLTAPAPAGRLDTPTVHDRLARPADVELAPIKQHRWRMPILGALILVGGVGGLAWWLIRRHADEAVVVAPAIDAASQVAAVIPDAAATPDAAPPAPPADAAEVASDAAVATIVDAGPADAPAEIEMDPAVADDPDPHAKENADDEAADAPKTPDDVDKRTLPPAAPVQAATVAEAVQLVKDGKRDLAIASLRALWKKSPGSSYIPFLLGNLYYDQRWWGVSMDHYSAAIAHDAKYKDNATLNRNVIRMLASPKTQATATTFLKKTIGHPAQQYLRQAATHEDNPTVRKLAAVVAKQIK